MAEEPRKPGQKGQRDQELGSTARQMQEAMPYISAVWKMVGGAVVGVLGGLLLDRWLGTKPWLLVVLSVVGISVGFYGFLREMNRLGKKK
ncbi:AtpZ/AtpI family protein [Hyalangium minutum]|uniref:ATP synthase protein I n=1 Tax=Hyalangium minutum TaxID=394096 RepID=A0A085WKA7_9BACT|nr:AtpZ/AtpI family protein [Hyalangium minutum]KFE68120.1 ATP synthase protein I [Hyalangium minutum]